jgi:CRP-like cAMP-binding protein
MNIDLSISTLNALELDKRAHRLSIEIKEANMEKEKGNLKKHQKLLSTFQKQIPLIKTILSKSYRFRTIKDTSKLFDFLILTGFDEELKSDLIFTGINLQQLFYFSSQFMSIKTFYKNNVIYYENAFNDYFYIVLDGEVNLYQMNIIEKKMKFLDYFKYLKDLNENNNDKFILNHTINQNKEKMGINKIQDLEKVDEIIFKNNLFNLIRNQNLDEINNLYEKNEKKMKNYKIDKLLSNEINFLNLLDLLYNELKEIELFYMKKINSNTKIETKIIENNLIKTVKNSEYFGNFDLEKNLSKRENSAIVQSNYCILLLVNKKLYSELIINENKKIIQQEIDPIYYHSIFRATRKNVFEKRLFKKLEKIVLYKNEFIYKENDLIDNFYILTEGNVEISIENKNIFHFQNLINKIKNFFPSNIKKEFEDEINLKNKLKYIKNELESKKFNQKIFFLDPIKTFGLIEYSYNNCKSFYNIKIISDIAKFYKIKIDTLINQTEGKIDDYELIKKEIEFHSDILIKSFLERLIIIKNSFLKKFDVEYSFQSKINEDNFYNSLVVHDLKNNMKNVNNNNLIHIKNFKLINKNKKKTHIKNLPILNTDFNDNNNNNNFIKIPEIKNYLINEKINKKNFLLTETNKSNENSHFKTSSIQIEKKNFDELKKSIEKDKKTYTEFFNTKILPSIKINKTPNKIAFNPFENNFKIKNLYKSYNEYSNKKNNEKLLTNFPKKIINKNYMAVKEFYKSYQSERLKNGFNNTKLHLTKKGN